MDMACNPALEDCATVLPDLTNAEAIEAIEWQHFVSHLTQLVEMVGGASGLIWYFLAPLGAGALPIVFHFLYRNTTYFSAAYNAVSPYYQSAWWTLWIGNVALNGIAWIFELIATFGVITHVNMIVWGIVGALQLVLFFVVDAFYIVAIDAANTAADTAMVATVQNELTLYIAITAFEMAMYTAFFPSWLAGMAIPLYDEVTSEDFDYEEFKDMWGHSDDDKDM